MVYRSNYPCYHILVLHAKYVGRCVRYLHKIAWKHIHEHTLVMPKVNAIGSNLHLATFNPI